MLNILNMPQYQVHRCNFYNYEPNSIHCLSFDKFTAKLAVSRADSSIEIWNFKNTPLQDRIIPPSPDAAIEAIAWCRSRLFSTGLNGYLTEYNLNTLKEKKSIPIIGGPAWCLAADKKKSNTKPSLLAVGTEEGYVCLYTVDDDDFTFSRRFDKQEGRILCLAFHFQGDILVTGSTDSIRVWNVDTGHAVNKVTVGRIKNNVETTVWCIDIMPDKTIVTGDSCGRTIFWDGETGTLISAFQAHKGDVLCLCVSRKPRHVYSSGIDPIICQFSPSGPGFNSHKSGWIKNINLSLHTHDVRALTFAKTMLVSGGVGSELVVRKFPPKIVSRYPPVGKNCIALSPNCRCLLLQYPKSLEIWKLGKSDLEDQDIHPLKLIEKETKALQLFCPEGEQIVCSAFSDDGKWLAYSTLKQIKLFSFSIVEDECTLVPTASLHKVRCLPEECTWAHHLSFTALGKYLLLATAEGQIQVMETNLIQPCLVHTFNGPSEKGDRINLLTCNPNGQMFAASDHDGNVTVYDLIKMKVHCTLPNYKCQAIALTFNPHNDNLMVAYANNKVIDYVPQRKCFSSWSQELRDLTRSNLDRFFPVLRIVFDPLNPDLLILTDSNSVYTIDKEALTSSSDPSKRSKLESIPEICDSNASLRVSKIFRHLLAFSSLCHDEMVAVELLPETIMERLPAAMRRKVFGT